MYIVAPLFFVTGAAMLGFSFRKNSRELLTFAACLWLISGVWNDFSEGFVPAVSSSHAP